MPVKYAVEMILLASLWGASFLFMRLATPEFGAIALIEVRVLVAGLVLLPFWFIKEKPDGRREVYANWSTITMIGILNSAIPFVLFAYSTLHVTGGFASILNATAPIWGAVVALVWLRKSLPASGVLGLVLGFAGVAYLVSGSLSTSFDGVTLGVLAASFAPFLYGIAANYTSEKAAHLSPLAIATFSQIYSAILLLPFALVFMPESPISVQAWLSVIALAVFCTSLAYLMYFRLIANIGSTKAITVTFLIPVFGTLWGALFISEPISLTMIIGTCVILIGTALVTGIIQLPVNHKSRPDLK